MISTDQAILTPVLFALVHCATLHATVAARDIDSDLAICCTECGSNISFMANAMPVIQGHR